MPLPKKKIKLEGFTDFKPGVGVSGKPNALQVIAQIRAAIQAKYDALGGLAVFGEPLAQDVGSWTFKDAMLVHNADLDKVFVVRGAIYDGWLRLGGLEVFGPPTTDETPTSDGVGRFNRFFDGTRMIYWSPDTGAHAVVGEIGRRWLQLGAEKSYLGYPTSSEEPFADGRANSFTGGGIYFWNDVGAIDLADVVVEFTGLYCFGETDSDQTFNTSDDPYAIFSITTPTSADALRSQVWQNINEHTAMPDNLELYRGRPYGIGVSVTLMEQDMGDPDKYLEKIETSLMAAHAAGTAAMAAIPVVGIVLAGTLGPLLAETVPAVAQVFNDLLDTGDDVLANHAMTFTGRDMVLTAAQGEDRTFEGLRFRIESPILAGQGASYKAHFTIRKV